MKEAIAPAGGDIGSLWESVVESIREEYLSETQSYPWIIGFSGGKDSTVLAQAVFEALLSIAPSRRTRAIHIVSNDTLVESPLVVAHLVRSQAAIREAATNWRLPVTVVTTTPAPEQTFWVLLIGRGYPSPNQKMRWCTDRLKIAPTSQYIRACVNKDGAAIVILGVRLDESNSRRASILKHENLVQSNLTPHTNLPGAFIYRPIVHLTTDQIWEIIWCFPPPWGGSHEGLIKLYKDSQGGECPFVTSPEDAPGCGTTSSRFGCWACTVVTKDKSLQNVVDAGEQRYSPLIEFRDWLKEIRNDPQWRSVERRNGKIQYSLTGKHIPGPFTIEARHKILARLLQTQEAFGVELISKREVDLIKRLWADELLRKGNRHG
ncbi:DNA phosphorothioation system sulfurtransferase DndC [Desulfobulbus elongatus]|uniref:DNA phosphorothioation system sulfurtransferase DndC n=1 Tax=Desulfobulbus elongatus TaxID=53332 RepID=UPI000A00DFE8|nr:DNA phosphorothioation system sulfurtransferase DndC [Desulfobulbus elongatus]